MIKIQIDHILIHKTSPFVLIAGPCAIETEAIALETADKIKQITSDLKIPFIFKSSYKKANRQSIHSFEGLGINEGLRILEKIKKEFAVPILTDFHTAEEAKQVAEVADVLQVPALLCRQTDIIVAAAKTGNVINIKKGQFMAPEDMGAITRKAKESGNDRILITERGTTFGYHNLVVDFRSLTILQDLGYPVVFDATHCLQLPGAMDGKSGGQPQFIFPLARAAVASGCQAIFLETHPNAAQALCDASTMLPLEKLRDLLVQLKQIDEVRKRLD